MVLKTILASLVVGVIYLGVIKIGDFIKTKKAPYALTDETRKELGRAIYFSTLSKDLSLYSALDIMRQLKFSEEELEDFKKTYDMVNKNIQ